MGLKFPRRILHSPKKVNQNMQIKCFFQRTNLSWRETVGMEDIGLYPPGISTRWILIKLSGVEFVKRLNDGC